MTNPTEDPGLEPRLLCQGFATHCSSAAYHYCDMSAFRGAETSLCGGRVHFGGLVGGLVTGVTILLWLGIKNVFRGRKTSAAKG